MKLKKIRMRVLYHITEVPERAKKPAITTPPLMCLAAITVRRLTYGGDKSNIELFWALEMVRRCTAEQRRKIRGEPRGARPLWHPKIVWHPPGKPGTPQSQVCENSLGV